MKKSLSTLAITLMMLSTLSAPAMADPFPTPVIYTTVYVVPGASDPEPDIDPDHRRKPSRPIPCTISRDNGLEIAATPTEFSAYEIWDAEGTACMGMYAAESDFIEALFSMPSGDYQIRLATADYELVGYLAL